MNKETVDMEELERLVQVKDDASTGIQPFSGTALYDAIHELQVFMAGNDTAIIAEIKGLREQVKGGQERLDYIVGLCDELNAAASSDLAQLEKADRLAEAVDGAATTDPAVVEALTAYQKERGND